jgi:hypothetical protein
MWFHRHLAEKGYCSNEKPKLKTRIKKEGRFFHYRVNTFTFSSFNNFHDIFYKLDPITNKYIKILPLNIENYFTPLTLAIWFMDDGSKLKKGG